MSSHLYWNCSSLLCPPHRTAYTLRLCQLKSTPLFYTNSRFVFNWKRISCFLKVFTTGYLNNLWTNQSLVCTYSYWCISYTVLFQIWKCCGILETSVVRVGTRGEGIFRDFWVTQATYFSVTPNSRYPLKKLISKIPVAHDLVLRRYAG